MIQSEKQVGHSFDNDRKKTLAHLDGSDKSKKGSIDTEILSLVDTINQHPDFYTTSSCAGRILCIKVPFPTKKQAAEWLFLTHDIDAAVAEPIIEAINDPASLDHTVWFKQESPIIHVCCRTIDAANQLLRVAYANGLKRSGIISISNTHRIIVALLSTENIETPLVSEHTRHVDDPYVQTLVTFAKTKLQHARDKFDRFLEQFSETYK
jgi:tRNA wybutosine-synthesizing protein 3